MKAGNGLQTKRAPRLPIDGSNSSAGSLPSGTRGFPGGEAAAIEQLKVYGFASDASAKSDQTYLHAKAYILETTDGDFCLWGSPNCSSAALVRSMNVELAMLQKAKRGHFVKALGLTQSLRHTQLIDASSLTFQHSEAASGSFLRLQSAEVTGGRLLIKLSTGANVGDAEAAWAEVVTGNSVTSKVAVDRVDKLAFAGDLSKQPADQVTFCRLGVTVDGNDVYSTFAAIHFAEAIAANTPSRRSASFHRLSEAIISGSLDWAKGLHQVCELIFHIDRKDAGAKSIRTAATFAKARKNDVPAEEVEDEHLEYESFVGEGKLSPERSSAVEAGVLADLLSALSSQMRSSNATSNDSAEEGEFRKYQEEVDSGTAESGKVQENLETDEQVAKARSILRRRYIRLMEQLVERCEKLREKGEPLTEAEMWRLCAVILQRFATDRMWLQ